MNVDNFSGTYFLDTNILVYAFDKREPAKQAIASQWIAAALETQRGIISTQVVQEFLNVVTGKFKIPLTPEDTRLYLQGVLNPLCQHFPSIGFYDHALSIKAETGYSLYDALIVTAALDSGCTTLLTEDMQAGRLVRNLHIVNPFKTAN